MIRLQEDIGLDILVDGEMERGDMVAFFAELLTESMAIGGLVRSYGNRYYHKPVITGKLHWQGPMTVEMWRYAQGLTDKPVKGMLTGPYTMVDWSFDEYYGDRVRAVLDMAEVVHQEALELDEAGAPFIQVDEPAASTRLDEMDLVSRGLTIVTQGLKAKTVHPHLLWRLRPRSSSRSSICRWASWTSRRPTAATICWSSSAADRFDKELAIGVLDVHNRRVETVEEVVAGIRRGLEVVPPQRLYIDPDCGLKTRTWDEAAAKLRVMVQGVRQVRKELGID